MDVQFSYDPIRNKGWIKTDLIDELREHFSSENKDATFSKNMFSPQRKYVITPSGRFDLGLYKEILQYLNTLDIPLNITFDQELKDVLKQSYNVSEIKELKLPLRYYQNDVVSIGLKKGYGTFELATGGGKTLIIATLIYNAYLNSNKENFFCLIIVPDIGLVNQTYSDFQEYELPLNVCKWASGNELDPSANVVIANTNYLLINKNTKWVKNVNMLIVDEVHKVKKDNQLTKFIQKNIKIPHKFGLTGTLPDEDIDRWTIIGLFGPVSYEKKSYELKNEGYLVPARILVLNLIYNTFPNYKTKSTKLATENYHRELEFIQNNNFRNNVISKLFKSINNNTLILTDRLDHGEILYEMIKNKYPDKKVYYIHGDVDVNIRDKVKGLIEDNNDVICIAISKIFSTGINIKNLHYLIFASGGKAKTKIIQSIGRGLRIHPTKDVLTIIDIADQLKYGKRHLQERLELYKGEKIDYKIKNVTQPV